MGISVIITTYNQPEWLQKTLIGFKYQIVDAFEVVIADDGSDERTKAVIEEFRQTSPFEIQHIWHPDTGFNKCGILNKAIMAAKYDYLLFTDGDCIPRRDFVAVHLREAERGRFLSGGYFKLNTAVSNMIGEREISLQQPFSPSWLRSAGQEFTYKMLKFVNVRFLEWLFNTITVTKPTWNGHNVSGFKDDIIAVNGYNEDMQYGGLDRELGERLENYGVRGKQIRYSAVCVHLDHPRPYRNKKTLSQNKAIRGRVKAEKIVWAERGIVK
jgi:glycosyltransferase involved in cell wall biosynthesis